MHAVASAGSYRDHVQRAGGAGAVDAAASARPESLALRGHAAVRRAGRRRAPVPASGEDDRRTEPAACSTASLVRC